MFHKLTRKKTKYFGNKSPEMDPGNRRPVQMSSEEIFDTEDENGEQPVNNNRIVPGMMYFLFYRQI